MVGKPITLIIKLHELIINLVDTDAKLEHFGKLCLNKHSQIEQLGLIYNCSSIKFHIYVQQKVQSSGQILSAALLHKIVTEFGEIVLTPYVLSWN